MKEELEKFYNCSFEELLKKRYAFTLIESSQTPKLSLQAKVFFNLAKMGYTDTSSPEYLEAKRDETADLGGTFFSFE